MPPVVPTDRELDALKILWDCRKSSVREIWKILAERDPDLAYTSVLSLMQSMEKKGLVGHEESGRAYVYFALAARDNVLRTLATRMLDRVFDGAVGEYLVHILESHGPGADELDELEKLVAEAKKRSRKPRSKGNRS